MRRRCFAAHRHARHAGGLFSTRTPSIIEHSDIGACLENLGRTLPSDEPLFPGFYKPILEGTATIRNKLGEAHGKGPPSIYAVTKELADHMLYTVCNNINLLVALAEAH